MVLIGFQKTTSGKSWQNEFLRTFNEETSLKIEAFTIKNNISKTAIIDGILQEFQVTSPQIN